jgi:glycerol-3-phosphate dehydrogenase (NAD(P)+)
MNRIVVAGGGVFGTSVAERLTWNRNNNVTIHTIEEDVERDINTNHQNTKYFPTKFLSPRLTATMDDSVFEGADVILLVLPSRVIVPFSERIRKHTTGNPLIVNLAKGMSDEGAFITEDIPFSRRASMKGPSFAIETMNGFPTSFTFGGEKSDYEYFRDNVLPHTGFTLDWTEDTRSVELCSILKNMYAIAIGLVSGKYGSPNVDFLVYTKAVREMRKLLRLYSCSEETIFCYCGLGDLGLTALNDLSRNRTFGMLIGKGFLFNEEKNAATVIEGKRTISIIAKKVKEEGIEDEFPLVTNLYHLLYEDGKLNDYYVAALK